MSARHYAFVAGLQGPWRIKAIQPLAGEPLPLAPRLDIVPVQSTISKNDSSWILYGIRSNERYVKREEKVQLETVQEGLGRPESNCAALIPIRKSASWWTLPQDERRVIFEEKSHHIKGGLKYLPPVARRLFHCRDLSDQEPFDFLTWFEYTLSYEDTFNELLAEMRESEEWKYVDREVDIRLMREGD